MANYTIQSGDTLNGIAKANNTTTDALLQTNKNITDPNKILAGSTINLPSTTNIDVNKIDTPINPLSIPQTQTNNYGSSIYQSAQNTVQDLYNKQQQISQDIINQQQQALSPLYQQQKQLQTEIAGKGADQLQMENNVNLASQRQQLANLQSQIAQQTTKFNAEQYNFSAAGNPITASVSRKDDAIQLAMMTAAAQGIQGNISAAETSINNAINLKYSDKEQQLQYVNDFIKTNEDKMTTAQKELANTKSTQIAAQIQQIQKDKEDMTSLITNAIKQGAPSSVTSKAALAATPLQAAQILGTYAGDYFKIKELQNTLNQNNIGNYSTNNVPIGSLTKESGMTVDDYIKGIAGVESSGQATPYTAIGPVVTTGMYAGDRAYGKYQVMGKNIPEWTKQAFGKAMTIQEFLASPEKQDALIKYRAEKDYAKYGNWDDVASVWFSGKPYDGNLSADVTGTTVPEYITRFRRYAGSSKGTTVSKTAQSYLDMFNKGTMSIDDIKNMIGSSKESLPLKNEVVNAINAQGGKRIYGNDTETISDMNTQITDLQRLIYGQDANGNPLSPNQTGKYITDNGKVINTEAGYKAISGPIQWGDLGSGQRGDALTIAGRVISSQTLKSLADAKAKGVTFGALSETELATAASAASNLAARADYTNGKLTGFKGSESEFKRDVETVISSLQKAISDKTGTNSTLNNWGGTVVDTYTNNSNNNYGFK